MLKKMCFYCNHMTNKEFKGFSNVYVCEKYNKRLVYTKAKLIPCEKCKKDYVEIAGEDICKKH